ncbi:unnamed protein product [Brugia pahangi]|uniref:Uncharacterized protein n=1 Tax=Brugia pahangi TaxID=6280 RepID=A0A0N4T4T4_BRUPA|nr:unnamed protein product [Brugia pahangi]
MYTKLFCLGRETVFHLARTKSLGLIEYHPKSGSVEAKHFKFLSDHIRIIGDAKQDCVLAAAPSYHSSKCFKDLQYTSIKGTNCALSTHLNHTAITCNALNGSVSLPLTLSKISIANNFPASVRDRSSLHEPTFKKNSLSFVLEQKPSSKIGSAAKVPRKSLPTKQRVRLGNRSKFRFRPRGKFGLLASVVGSAISGIIDNLRK